MQFTCTTDGNPYPLLSLHTRTPGAPDVELANQTEASPEFMTAVTMTHELDNTDFICKAQGDTPSSYLIESNTVTYSVTCKQIEINW